METEFINRGTVLGTENELMGITLSLTPQWKEDNR